MIEAILIEATFNIILTASAATRSQHHNITADEQNIFKEETGRQSWLAAASIGGHGVVASPTV